MRPFVTNIPCTHGSDLRNSSAHKSGIRSNGNTFAIMSRNEEASDIPSTGWESARNSGAITATAIFICIV